MASIKIESKDVYIVDLNTGYSLVLRGNDLVIKLDSATIFVHGNDNVALNFAAA